MTQAFNLSQLANNVNTSGQLNAAAGLYNQTPVANGGTGVATIASGAVILGAGISAVTTVPAATSGNVLTANGTAWVSQAASGGTPVVTIYTAPATWSKPSTVKFLKVTVLSGGGSGGTQGNSGSSASGGGGGGGGYGYFPAPSIPGPVAVTVGSGGTAVGPTAVGGVAGGTSSFGALISATGGGAGAYNANPGNTNGGSGGAITSSSTVLGAPGQPGYQATTNVRTAGGDSFGSFGYGGQVIPSTIGINGIGYGSGGASSNNGSLSGTGRPGFIIVEEFY